MFRFIPVAWIMCMSGCALMKRDAQQTEMSASSHQVFCSETNGNQLHLRLTVDFKTTTLKERTIRKQFEMPYFKRENGNASLRISREIVEWRNDRIVLAEVIPTETMDIFMLYVTSFERSKRVKFTSSAYLLLRLCQDAEMTIGGDKELHALKARLELVNQFQKL